MIVLLDTSVIVEALYQGHPVHQPARSWLERGQREEIQVLFVAAELAGVAGPC